MHIVDLKGEGTRLALFGKICNGALKLRAGRLKACPTVLAETLELTQGSIEGSLDAGLVARKVLDGAGVAGIVKEYEGLTLGI